MQNQEQLDLLLEENRQLKEELKSLKAKEFSFTDSLKNEELMNDLEGEFSKIKDKTQEVSSQLKEQITQNPIQSISIAFTLGLLLSKVFGGRR